jgi:hypothetical protein
MAAGILWVKDGVLLDRMHVNPVAFAFSAILHTKHLVSIFFKERSKCVPNDQESSE